MITRLDELKEIYNLRPHEEGGSFAEVYTAPFEKDGRPLAGSIYFLLGPGEVSHFHQIDCDELWFYHEGCGMRITVLLEGEMKTYFLGMDIKRSERAMISLPAGCIFAAENLHPDSYTFISCMTTPGFTYEGFRLVDHAEIYQMLPESAEEIEHLCIR